MFGSTFTGACVVSGWRDISTAPRVEASAIILFNGREVVPGFVWENGWADCWHSWMDPQPTHWQPLPDAPVQS